MSALQPFIGNRDLGLHFSKPRLSVAGKKDALKSGENFLKRGNVKGQKFYINLIT